MGCCTGGAPKPPRKIIDIFPKKKKEPKPRNPMLTEDGKPYVFIKAR